MHYFLTHVLHIHSRASNHKCMFHYWLQQWNERNVKLHFSWNLSAEPILYFINFWKEVFDLIIYFLYKLTRHVCFFFHLPWIMLWFRTFDTTICHLLIQFCPLDRCNSVEVKFTKVRLSRDYFLQCGRIRSNGFRISHTPDTIN